MALLGKSSIDTIPLKLDAHNNAVTMETEMFSVWCAPRLYSEDPGWLSAVK
jgi:hypothetical protein